MRLLSVIPINKSFFGGRELSYFSSKEVEVGSLVSINLRSRKVPALVVRSDDIKKQKTAIKSASFKIKKITGVLSGSFLSTFFIDAVRSAGEYYLTPPGTIFKQFIPSRILAKGSPVVKQEKASSHFQPVFIQTTRDERIRYYKSAIRESFARGESVVLLLPTVEETENMYNEIRKGIEDKTVILHGSQGAKRFDSEYKQILDTGSPLVVVGTAFCLFAAREDTGAIIIEHEFSPAYKKIERPFIDVRRFAENLARNMGARFIVGDLALSMESYFRKTQDTSPAAMNSNLSIESRAQNLMIPLEKQSFSKDFSFIGRELKEKLTEVFAKKEKMVLFINRKGLNPMTICMDCSAIVSCKNCSSPLVLYGQKDKQNKFLCNKCFQEATLNDRCPSCGSWKLKSYGAGIEKVADELHSLFPEANIFRMDGVIIKNRKQGEALKDKFLKSPNPVLITTELFFSYFKDSIDNVFVVSVDNLFTIPDFKMTERIFRLLLRLRLMAARSFAIQTRMPDTDVFKYVLTGNLTGFYRDELKDREDLGYPPFVTLIKLSYSHKSVAKLTKEVALLQKKLADYDPLDFPAFIAKINNIYTHNILLKLQSGSWPDGQPELRALLAEIDPGWVLEVDPDSIL